MILESIINFRRFQIVRLNPDNPGGGNRLPRTLKNKEIIRVVCCGKNKAGWTDYKPTGFITVLWNNTRYPENIHYRHLLIVKEAPTTNGIDATKTLQEEE